MSDTNGFIQQCKLYIKLMLNIQQWSGIDKSDVDLWLNNFSDVDEDDMYYIYKLLINIIYFSERDVNNILEDGLYNCLFYDEILQNQLQNNFQLSKHAINSIVKEKILKSYFVPLLDSSKPHESGNYVMRQLVQNGLITTNQSGFHNDIVKNFDKNFFTRIIIVDDCVGSGNQVSTFWNKSKTTYNNREVLFKDWVKLENIPISYLTLFGFENSIDKIRNELPELHIFCVKMLNDIHRVFGDESYIWKDNNELLLAKNILENILLSKDIPLYGYKDLDFAFIMHRTIPNWSLPIFWKENPDFKCLLRRKNSNA